MNRSQRLSLGSVKCRTLNYVPHAAAFSLLLTVSSLSLMAFYWHKVIKVDTLQQQVKWPWPFTISEKTFLFFWNLYQLPRSWSDNGIKGNCISSAQLYKAMENWGRCGSSEPTVVLSIAQRERICWARKTRFQQMKEKFIPWD